MAEVQSIFTTKTPEGVQIKVNEQYPPQGAELKDLLLKIESNPVNKTGPIFVKIPDIVFHRFLPQLLQLQYQFHRHDETHGSQTSFVFYKWNDPLHPDTTQPQATSLDHFAALVFSPDETQVLMIKEDDKWKFPTGPVTKVSGTFTGMVSFLVFNYGINLDPGFRPVYVGGWIREKGRHGFIHDRMDCFAVRSAGNEIKCSVANLQDVTWLPVTKLVEVLANHQTNPETVTINNDHKKLEMDLLQRKKDKFEHLIKLKHAAQNQGFFPDPLLVQEIKNLERDIMGFHYNEEQQKTDLAELPIESLELEIKKIGEEMFELQKKQEIRDVDIIYAKGQGFNKYHLAWLARACNKATLSIEHSLALGSNNPLFLIGV